MKYHAPRIHYNESQSIIYPPSCEEMFNYNYFQCSIDHHSPCEASKISSASVYLIDFEKEDKMRLGRTFDLENTPNYGEVIITQDTANNLGVDEIGETIYISLPINSGHIPLLINYLNDKYFHQQSIYDTNLLDLINQCSAVILPLNVSYISDISLGGKFPERSSNEQSYKFDAAINIRYFMEMFMVNLPPILANNISEIDENYDTMYDNETIYNYVNMIYVNLPPNRITSYLSMDYDAILEKLVTFAGAIRYKIGWNQINIELDILNSMHWVSYRLLSLSVVLNMIILVLVLLSTGLLYSLLVISVDSKRFMLGTLRMLGMSKTKLVNLLITQSLGYSIPAYVVGMILAQFGVVYFSGVLESAGNVELNATLSSNAIIIATTVGIGCSLFAAIFPIRHVLQQNLRDILDVKHSATKAVRISLDRSDNFEVFSWNTLVICSVMLLMGWFAYYFLPQAFLNGNLAELAIMLFSLLLAMFFGFVLMGINTVHLIERIVVKLILFWEKRPIPNIVIKNLIAHRVRNRKTAMMYALSLSFMFLVTVMIASQIEFMKGFTLKNYGQELVCEPNAWHTSLSSITSMEDFLSGSGKYEKRASIHTIHQYIESFSWRPKSAGALIFDLSGHFADASTSNLGKTFQDRASVYIVPPNFESVSVQRFIEATNKISTSLTGTESLFTAMGSQRVMTGSHTATFLKLKSVNDRLLLKFEDSKETIYYGQFRSIGWYSLYPHYGLDNIFANEYIIGMSSIPRLFDCVDSIEDIIPHQVLIKLKTNVVHSERNYVKEKLQGCCKTLWDYDVFAKEMEDSATMLDLIFSVNTYMALFLCLFSLVSSMSSNIMEQNKEIGVFRSMGLTKFEINKLYVYEALVLILSASFIGMIIGCVLCYVALKQQSLLSGYPVGFYVPQSVLGACITGAIFTSILSVWYPLKNLNKKQISHSLRK